MNPTRLVPVKSSQVPDRCSHPVCRNKKKRWYYVLCVMYSTGAQCMPECRDADLVIEFLGVVIREIHAGNRR